MRAGGEQQRHRQWIEYGDKRQSEQADRSLEVVGRRTDQLCEISDRADVGLGAPALGVNPGFLDLQAGKSLSLALARRNDVGAITALLVSDRYRADGAAKPCRLLDGRVDLGDAPIEVGDRLSLDGEAGLGVGGSIRERRPASSRPVLPHCPQNECQNSRSPFFRGSADINLK
jgi:hypothetical protein